MSIFGSRVSRYLHIYSCFRTYFQNSLKISRFVNVSTWVFGDICQFLALDLEHLHIYACFRTYLQNSLKILIFVNISTWVFGDICQFLALDLEYLHIYAGFFGLGSVSIYTRTYNQFCLQIQSFVNVSTVALKDTHWKLDFEDLPIYLEIGLLIQSVIYFSTWVPKCIYHLFFWNRYTRYIFENCKGYFYQFQICLESYKTIGPKMGLSKISVSIWVKRTLGPKCFGPNTMFVGERSSIT